jgi:transposase
VEQWQREEFPAIQRQVEVDNAMIFFADEAGGSKITLLFLPPYSPDLNADEWAWKQVKQRIAGQSVRTRDDLKRIALSALRSLQQMPEKIRGFFRDPACCYAKHKFRWLYQWPP